MAKSAIEKFKEADEERQKALVEAKEEALSKANEAVKELNDLGFNYRLTTAAGVVGSKGSVTDEACDICGFKTSPPHDGRKHRSQVRKRAFTDGQLKELDLTRV